jgi:uncharacterized protein involved in exopolysaccharide biosynthesis
MQNRITLKNPAPESEKKPSNTISLFELARLLIRKRMILTVTVGAVMMLTAVIMFLIPNKYMSTASILPSGKNDKLSALKELTGMGNFPSISEDNSSLLFPEILKSNQIKEGVFAKEYTFTHDSQPKSLSLKEYFGEDNPELLNQEFDKITSVYMEKKTGLIKISVETEYPELSQAVLSQMLTELDNFNLYKRRSQARNNERYLARELAGRDTELKAAEEKLEEFQNVNRDWDNSSDPEIQKTIMQLKRDIEIKTRAYLFLQEQHELAKLDAQKDVPVVILLDTPSLPILKSGPPRTLSIILSGIAAFFAAFFYLFIADSLRRNRNNVSSQEWQSLGSDLKEVLPFLKRHRQEKEIASPVTSD